ncbi:GGDEF domain protein [Desulfocucumis palustris]|uniref:GGDEF domain protein n=1 Tax=Desulfocucumis palustris TaxID=1898651 RepID=A0A2L2X8R7_9FIRM|nr:GGDEF domain-containing protein [Desulfocucumis palustris]GBF32314.1 GGDEF domain protein [Desulfocucumis palustris]
MSPAMNRKITALALPLGITALAWVLFFKWETAAASFIAKVDYSAYIIFLIGFLVSYRFNRSGIFYTLTVLMLCRLWTVNRPAASGGAIDPDTIYNSICFLIPLNIVLFSLLRERGILTSGGRGRAGIILLQVLFVVAAALPGGEDIAGLLAKNVFPPGFTGAHPVPQPALPVFLLSFAALVYGHLSGRFFSMANYYAGVLPAIFAALYYRDHQPAGPVFFSASGIILLVALLQDSYSKAYLDELTGLPGRRALKEELLKLGGTYAIAMLDIDFFKKFNDTHGHHVGDQVLKLVGSIIKDVGGGGKAYRYGGEEFTIIFPGKKTGEAIPYLEKLRETIAKRPFILRGKDRPAKKPDEVKPGGKPAKKLHITVSIGVSEKSEKHKTADEVVKAADTSLYKAKKNGRNRVEAL